MLEAAAALGGLALAGRLGAESAVPLRRTPAQILGPFYPLVKPLDQDADLTTVTGRPGRARGQIVHVAGRVLDARGRPLEGARIEVWQANASGRYAHPSDRHDAPLDPNFEGYAVLRTDAEGRYRFKTIKPGAYPDDGSGAMRAPHIHFDVCGRINRLVTQMYFAGEPLNDSDRFLRSAGARRGQLIVAAAPLVEDPDGAALLANWDIVLEDG